MWIVTSKGFFTFVTDRKDPSYLWLRARLRAHIEDNFPGVVVTEHPGADYLYRAKVKRTDVAERIAELIMDSRIDSHFKDEFIKTAAKPATGSLSTAMYAFWNAAAQWQPYAPYSKVPRGQEPRLKPWTPPAPPATGGKTITVGSTKGGYDRARDYDWSTNPWSRQGTPVGEPARDDVVGGLDLAELDEMSAEEFDQVWATLTPEQQMAYLDREEQELRDFEARYESQPVDTVEPDFPAFRAPLPGPRDWAQVEADRRQGDRERQTKVRGRKGRKRRNRHNQQG